MRWWRRRAGQRPSLTVGDLATAASLAYRLAPSCCGVLDEGPLHKSAYGWPALCVDRSGTHALHPAVEWPLTLFSAQLLCSGTVRVGLASSGTLVEFDLPVKPSGLAMPLSNPPWRGTLNDPVVPSRVAQALRGMLEDPQGRLRLHEAILEACLRDKSRDAERSLSTGRAEALLVAESRRQAGDPDVAAEMCRLLAEGWRGEADELEELAVGATAAGEAD